MPSYNRTQNQQHKPRSQTTKDGFSQSPSQTQSHATSKTLDGWSHIAKAAKSQSQTHSHSPSSQKAPSQTYSKDTISEYTEPEKIHFPCQECKGPLPIKQLPNGDVVKRWDDNVCGACWAADDIIKQPEKYQFTRELQHFLELLTRDDLRTLFFHEDSTMWGDLVSDLYRVMNNWDQVSDTIRPVDGVEQDPLQLFKQLRSFLAPIKCHKFYLAMQLHRKLTR